MIIRMKRTAIYARVSTVDRGQDPETQLRQLREYAERRGFRRRARVRRPCRGPRTTDGVPRHARSRRAPEFDVVLVWRYDRFARSIRELVNALSEFEGLGIDFISYNEGADTTTPQGKLLFGIMASLAEFERSLIAERVKAGWRGPRRRASTPAALPCPLTAEDRGAPAAAAGRSRCGQWPNKRVSECRRRRMCEEGDEVIMHRPSVQGGRPRMGTRLTRPPS